MQPVIQQRGPCQAPKIDGGEGIRVTPHMRYKINVKIYVSWIVSESILDNRENWN